MEKLKEYDFVIIDRCDTNQVTKILSNDDNEYELPTVLDSTFQSIKLLVTGHDEKRDRYFFSQKTCDESLIYLNKKYSFKIDSIERLGKKTKLICHYLFKEKKYSYLIICSNNILAFEEVLVSETITGVINSIFGNELRLYVESISGLDNCIIKTNKIIDFRLSNSNYFIDFDFKGYVYTTFAKDWQFIFKESFNEVILEYNTYEDKWYQLFEKYTHPHFVIGEEYDLKICKDIESNALYLETEFSERLYNNHYIKTIENSSKTKELIGTNTSLVYKGLSRGGNLLFDFFIDFQKVTSSKPDYFVFKRILDNNIYNIDDDRTIVLYEKFRDYYLSYDNRWIIAYVNYLAKVTDDYLNNKKDYRTASYLIETIIKISSWIKDSNQFVSIQNQSSIEYNSARIIKKNQHILKAVELIFDNKAIEYVEKYIKNIEYEKVDIYDELYFITVILRQLDYDDLDELLLKLVKLLGVKEVFKNQKVFYAEFFEKLLFERIRYFENILLMEVFSTNEARDTFFNKHSNEIKLVKEYINYLLNLLKDNKREVQSIYKIYSRSLKFAHYSISKDSEKLKYIDYSFNALNKYADFQNVVNKISWNKDFNEYVNIFSKSSEVIKYLLPKSEVKMMKVLKINSELSRYELSDDENKTYNVILPFYLSNGYLKKNETIGVEILALDEIDQNVLVRTINRVSEKLSINQRNHLKLSKVYKVVIKSITKYGLFVTIGEDEGLVGLSEIAFTPVDKEKLNSLFKINQVLEVKLIRIDKDKRLFFSLKEAFKLKRYKVNDKVKGLIFSFGYKHANIQLEDGSHAKLYIENISSSYIIDFKKYLEIGEEINCEILSINDNELIVNSNISYEFDDKKEYKAKYLYTQYKYNYYKIFELNIVAKEDIEDEFEPKYDEQYLVKLNYTGNNKYNIDSIKILEKIDLNSLKIEVIIEKAYLYESLSYIQTSLDKKIDYLEFSKYYFSLANNARAYYLKIYIYYIELIKRVNTTVYEKESLQNLRDFALEILSNIDNQEVSIEIFPIINQFKDTVVIIGQIDEDYKKTSTVFQDNSFFDLHDRTNMLAKQVLSFNMLETNINLREQIWNLIKTSLSTILEKLYFDVNEFDENFELRKRIETSLRSNEGKTLEFKATIFTPVFSKADKARLKFLEDKTDSEKEIKEINELLKLPERVKGVKNAFLKTLAAFSNSEGGTLVVGIDEDVNSNPIEFGVEVDLKKFKNDSDNYLRNIDMLVSKNIGKEYGNHYRTHLVNFKNKPYLIIDVKKSEIPIFVNIDGVSSFYIRENNQCEKLVGVENYKYISDRF